MIFQKGDKIQFNNKNYIAICVDQDIAIFAPIKRIKKDNCLRTFYKRMIALCNREEFRDSIDFEFVDVIE